MKKRLSQFFIAISLILLLFFPFRIIGWLDQFFTPYFSPITAYFSGPELTFPNGQKDLYAFPDIPDQWNVQDQRFAIVVFDDQPLFYSPKSNKKKEGSLHISSRVRVFFMMKGWVFVATPDLSEAIGWIPRENIGFKSDFIKIKTWEFGSVGIKKDIYKAAYTIKNNASFYMQWQAVGSGLHLKGESHGHMMRYGNVIWAKKSQETVWKDFFFLDEDVFLYTEISVNPERKKALLL